MWSGTDPERGQQLSNRFASCIYSRPLEPQRDPAARPILRPMLAACSEPDSNPTTKTNKLKNGAKII